MAKKKKLKNRTKFVICACAALIIFTIVCAVLVFMDKELNDTLIVSWFSAWTVELALLAGIKIKDKDEE